jgi:DNA-binding beta-propeller fold protein YncE
MPKSNRPFPFALMLLVVIGVGKPAIASALFWSDWTRGQIFSANLDTSNAQAVFSSPTADAPRGIAIDPFAQKIYWTQFGSSMRIARANLDGTGVEGLVTTGVSGAAGIDLDLVHGKMYWTDHDLDQIKRADLDGTHIETIVTSSPATPVTFPWGIAVDAMGDRIYWVDSAHVWGANLDGTNAQELVSGPPPSGLIFFGIAIDSSHGKVYFANSNTKIQRMNLDGSGIEDIVTTGLHLPKDLDIDPVAQKLYWVEPILLGSTVPGVIKRANLDGSDIVTLKSSTAQYSAIAVYSAIPEPASTVICSLLLCMLHLRARARTRA